MLTLFVRFEDLYLQYEFEYYGNKLKTAAKKLEDCCVKFDADGMKYWNEICYELVTKRESIFKKRLKLRGC
jgi:hypothetical protein